MKERGQRPLHTSYFKVTINVEHSISAFMNTKGKNQFAANINPDPPNQINRTNVLSTKKMPEVGRTRPPETEKRAMVSP